MAVAPLETNRLKNNLLENTVCGRFQRQERNKIDLTDPLPPERGPKTKLSLS